MNERIYEINAEFQFIQLYITRLSQKGELSGRWCEISDWPVALSIRFVRLLETILEDPRCYEHPVFWLIYVHFTIKRGKFMDARKIYIRGIQACPFSKELWILALTELRRAFKDDEIKMILEKTEVNGMMMRSS